MAEQKPNKEVSISIDDHPRAQKKIVTVYDGKPTRFWITRSGQEAADLAADLAARYEKLGWSINKGN